MKLGRITAGLAFIAALALCLDLFGGIVLLRNGRHFSGRILTDDNMGTTIGYSDGSFRIAKSLVEKIVGTRDLSDYGKKLLVPSDDEVISLEKRAIGAPAASPTIKQAEQELRNTQQILKGGESEFSFSVPSNWVADTRENVTVFVPSGEPGTAVLSACVIETPKVTAEEQRMLTESALRAELNGLTILYSLVRSKSESKIHEYYLVGTYGPQNNKMVLRTILRRTATHTFMLTFFVKKPLYWNFESTFRFCLDSVEVRKSQD